MRTTLPDEVNGHQSSNGLKAHLSSGHFPLARLLQLIIILQTECCPNARQLAEMCEVSRRTIYRDLATLAAAGITVTYRPDRQGYQLARSLVLQPPRLEEREALALFVISRQWNVTNDLGLLRPAQHAVDKLLQGLHEEFRARLMVSAELFSESAQSPVLSQERQALHASILAALADRRQIRLWFQETGKPDLETTKLGLYRLPLICGQWYLIGRSTLHRQVKLFPVTQIQRVEVTADPYTIPPRFNLARFLAQAFSSDNGSSGHRVVLRFSPRVSPRFGETHYLWPREQELRPRDDGSADLIFTVGGLDEILPVILSLGDHVEVLAPEQLRIAVREMAGRIIDRHTTCPEPDPRTSSSAE
jgi:predicted DNA-binding transcriptional regulator YafY